MASNRYTSIRASSNRASSATRLHHNRKTRGDGDDPFRPRPVYSRAESRIRQRRNRDKGRHGPTSATALLYRRSCPEWHGFGSLFSGLLRTVASLIKRGAVALGKHALATGAQIAGDVVAGKNVKKTAKTKGNGCRHKSDAKPSQHTTTSR